MRQLGWQKWFHSHLFIKLHGLVSTTLSDAISALWQYPHAAAQTLGSAGHTEHAKSEGSALRCLNHGCCSFMMLHRDAVHLHDVVIDFEATACGWTSGHALLNHQRAIPHDGEPKTTVWAWGDVNLKNSKFIFVNLIQIPPSRKRIYSGVSWPVRSVKQRQCWVVQSWGSEPEQSELVCWGWSHPGPQCPPPGHLAASRQGRHYCLPRQTGCSWAQCLQAWSQRPQASSGWSQGDQGLKDTESGEAQTNKSLRWWKNT